MTSLSDTLTMGIVLALVFGSIVFYLYSRLLQVEKRMNLTENLLLDMKTATENTLFAMGPGFAGMGGHRHDDEEIQNERVEPISEPVPVSSQEVEEIGEEDFYKSVLANTLDTTLPEENAETFAQQQQAPKSPSPIKEIQLSDVTGRNDRAAQPAVQVTKMEPNYEAMSLKELKSLAKQRGINVTSHAGKKEVIDALKKGTIAAPEAGSQSSAAFPIEGAEILE